MPGETSAGQRVAELRKLRGFTQRELSTRAAVSYSLVSKVESGSCPATPTFLTAVARALRVDIAELTGQPYRGTTARDDAIHAPIAELRREIVVYDRPPDQYEGPIPQLSDLRERVANATRMRQAGSYVRLGAALPTLICDLRAAIHSAHGTTQESAYGMLAEAYDAARALAYKLGYLDLASLLVTRHAYAASHSGDPLETAVGDTMRAHEMISVGEFRAAENTMTTTLRRIEDTAGGDDAASLSVHGYLHLEAGLATARAGNADATEGHLAEARAIADRIGADRDDYRLAFGPTNVDIWSVGLAVELGDGAKAVARAAQIRLPSSTPRERASHYFIDLARGQLWHGGPSARESVLSSLLAAREIAPTHTRYHPMVRETVRALARLERRKTDSLAGFAKWLGMHD